MRSIFKLNKYDKKSRLSNAINFSKFSEFITSQGVNVIFANIGMFHKARERNRYKIKNYIEIYIQAKLNKIIKKGKKNIQKKCYQYCRKRYCSRASYISRYKSN